MTQAFNLSQLANKVNTSGQLDASTGLVNAVAVANGGTGLTAVGTTGNVLTSNGTAWVSSAPAGGGFSGGATTSSAVDITLTNTSPQIQNITMTAANKYVILPNATTLTKGSAPFQINANGGYDFGIKDGAGNIIGYLMPAGKIVLCALVDNSTAKGLWITTSMDGYLVTTSILANTISTLSTLGSNYLSAQMTVLSSTLFAIIYTQSQNIYAVAGTISGSTVTYGTPFLLKGPELTIVYPQMSIVKTSATSAACSWTGTYSSGSFVFLRGISISGTTITAGTQTDYDYTTYANQSKSYMFALNSTTAILSTVSFNASGNFATLRAITASGSTLTVGTAVAVGTASVGAQGRPAPITSSSFVWGTSAQCNIYSVSGTTITTGAAYTGTNATLLFLRAGYYGYYDNWTPSAFISSTQALVGEYLVTFSGTTVSSIARLDNPCEGWWESVTSSNTYSVSGKSIQRAIPATYNPAAQTSGQLTSILNSNVGKVYTVNGTDTLITCYANAQGLIGTFLIKVI